MKNASNSAHICMIVWNAFRNDARVLREAQTLARAGYRVTVFALHEPGKTQKYEEIESGIAVRRVNRSPFGWCIRAGNAESNDRNFAASPLWTSRLRIAKQIVSRGFVHAGLVVRLARAQPDLIHAHDINTLPTAWVASRISGARLVYDAHEISTDREGYQGIRGIVAWIEKRLMPRASATITTTEMRAKFFARAYGIVRPLVLQNRPRFVEVQRSSRIRDELQMKDGWPIILYQGGLQQGRGLERLALVATSVPDAYFVFIGGGRLEGRLRQLVEQQGLEKRVHFIPTVELDELLSYTSSADIGVQPIENTCLNHYTTDSNKLFEYLMAGLPVVASSLPEIRRIVIQYGCGMLVPQDGSDTLGEVLRTLLADPALRDRLAANSRRAAAELNWEAQEHELIALYERTLN